MATYIDMITRIQDDLVNESITVAQIKNAIITAISNYENTPFYFNQKIGTFNTIGSQEYYGAAALADIPNIVKFRSAVVVDSGYSTQLNAVDFSEMDNRQDNLTVGRPYAYSAFAQQLRLYPIPDKAYTVDLAYVYKFATLSADSDTNAWTNDAEEMIRQCAKRRLALDIFYSDKIAARCKMLEDEAYDGLMDETASRLPNTELRSPNFPLRNYSFDIRRGY
jgi:hypothetical protein